MTLTVIVTGGSRGLGLELSKHLAKGDYQVISCGRSKPIGDIESIEWHNVDLSEPSSVIQFLNHVYQKHKSIDCIINNAAIFGPIGPLDSFRLSGIERVLNLNLLAPIQLVTQIIQRNKMNLLRVINIGGGGIGGSQVEQRAFPYVLSKIGLHYATEILATEFESTQLLINTVSPGALPTDFMDDALSMPAEISGLEILQGIENRKKLDSQKIYSNIKKIVEFLLSEKSNTVNGCLLSAQWDDLEFILEYVRQNKHAYRLRRIDGQLFDVID